MKYEALIVERGRIVYTQEIELPDVYSHRSATRYIQKMYPGAILITEKSSK